MQAEKFGKIAVRIALALAYIFVLYYNMTYVRFPPHKNQAKRFGGKAEYLTILNLVFLTGSLIFSCLCDYLPKSSSEHFLHQIKGTANAASATISLFVCLSFWSIYAINRELVFPAVLDSIIPPWHNHAIHTTVFPVSLIGYALTPKNHCPRFTSLLATASCLVVAYTVWIHIIYLNTGRWVYPVLAVLGGPARVLFIGVCALSIAPFAYAVHAVKTRLEDRQQAAVKAAKREKRQQQQKAKARKAQ